LDTSHVKNDEIPDLHIRVLRLRYPPLYPTFVDIGQITSRPPQIKVKTWRPFCPSSGVCSGLPFSIGWKFSAC
jgi:hypothetical protein